MNFQFIQKRHADLNGILYQRQEILRFFHSFGIHRFLAVDDQDDQQMPTMLILLWNLMSLFWACSIHQANSVRLNATTLRAPLNLTSYPNKLPAYKTLLVTPVRPIRLFDRIDLLHFDMCSELTKTRLQKKVSAKSSEWPAEALLFNFILF